MKQAFTLIELLVTIAIIAILSGLMLPALASAKEKGRQASCYNGVRQQSFAVLMYAQDFGDSLPPTAYNSPTGEVDWPKILDPYLWNFSTVHLCPTDRKSRVNSYGLNELIFVDLTDDNHLDPMKLGTVRPMAIMQGDLGTENDFRTQRPDTLKLTAPDSDLNDPKDARPSLRHSSRCDLGFMDGHAENRRLSQFYIDRLFFP